MLGPVVNNGTHAMPRCAFLIGVAAEFATSLSTVFGELGWSTVRIASGAETLEQLAATSPSLVVVDYDLHDLPPVALTRQFRAESAQVQIVALIPESMVELAQAAEQAGAAPVIVASVEQVTRAVRELIARDALPRPLAFAEACNAGRRSFFSGYRSLFRRGETMRKVEHAVFCFADAKGCVLVRGESGVGKRAVAQAIHYLSPRSQAPWAEINCTAVPPRLLDAQIFGCDGAAEEFDVSASRGAIAEADGGTLLLEEIAQVPSETQAALAEFLQHGIVQRGGHVVRRDVRVIATTTADLEQLVAAGSLREDLFRHLSQMTICVPPLRDRPEEIPGLADFFRARFMEQFRRDVSELSGQLLDLLGSYHWPGNVLELENVIKRYVVGGNEQQLTQELETRAERQDAALLATADTLQEIGQRAALQAEMAIIIETLERVDWNRAEAARRLKVSYKTLLNKLRRAGITGRRTARTFPRT